MTDAQNQSQASFLGDIPVEVVVELGRTKMVLRDLANLDTDDVVELNQPMDKPLDVVVGGKLIARGELVMVAERMAPRITDVSSSGTPEKQCDDLIALILTALQQPAMAMTVVAAGMNATNNQADDSGWRFEGPHRAGGDSP